MVTPPVQSTTPPTSQQFGRVPTTEVSTDLVHYRPVPDATSTPYTQPNAPQALVSGPVAPLDVPNDVRSLPPIKLRCSGPDDQWMVAGQQAVLPPFQWSTSGPGVTYCVASHGLSQMLPSYWICASPYSCPSIVPRYG